MLVSLWVSQGIQAACVEIKLGGPAEGHVSTWALRSRGEGRHGPAATLLAAQPGLCITPDGTVKWLSLGLWSERCAAHSEFTVTAGWLYKQVPLI